MPPMIRTFAADGQTYIGAALPLERALQAARVGVVLVAPALYRAASDARDPTARAAAQGAVLLAATYSAWAWWQVRQEVRATRMEQP
jgi:hypothetical protein